MHYLIKTIGFVGVLSLVACQNTAKTTLQHSDIDFFNIPAYFDAEAERLTKLSGLQVQKLVVLDGKEEKEQLNIKDWKKELALFSKIQIHGATQKEKYSVDSSFAADGSLVSVIYRSNDPKTHTKEVSVNFVAKAVSAIQIRTASENEVYLADQLMIYTPDKGYHIEKMQKVTLHSAHNYLIDLKFIQ